MIIDNERDLKFTIIQSIIIEYYKNMFPNNNQNNPTKIIGFPIPTSIYEKYRMTILNSGE
jgi:hypothetical protein